MLKILDYTQNEQGSRLENELSDLGFLLERFRWTDENENKFEPQVAILSLDALIVIADVIIARKPPTSLYNFAKAGNHILWIFTSKEVAALLGQQSVILTGTSHLILNSNLDINLILTFLSQWGIKPDSSNFDEIINTLIDGNEEQRIALVNQLEISRVFNKKRLSARLRKEITDNFTPARTFDFTTAARDPNMFSSIRSWMLSALIYNDAEDPQNQRLLLNHLLEESEADETVQYWTLAGLYKKNVSYLGDAIDVCLEQSSRIVTMLANAIARPKDQELISSFRLALNSKEYSTQWEVLRIMRVVSIPELVPTVIGLINGRNPNPSAAYDAYYALANKGNAEVAGPILNKSPGVQLIVSQIISILNNATAHALANFANILYFMDETQVSSEIDKARINLNTRRVAVQLRNLLNRIQKKAGQNVPVAGYSPDTINTQFDFLGIQVEVKVLTSVMLAKDIEPPLAIGLFGSWGSGKSFFIRSMQDEIIAIQKKYSHDPASVYCTNIVAIEFNAWHYIDTDIYASLVATIFDKLSEYILPTEAAEAKQAKFLSELSSTQLIIKEISADKTKAQATITEKQEELKKLQGNRLEKEIQLKEIRIDDIQKLLTSMGYEKQMNDALNSVGIPAVIGSLDELNNAVKETYTVPGRFFALISSLAHGKNRWLTILLMLIFLGIIPIIGWAIKHYFHVQDLIANISIICAQISSIIVMFSTAIRKAMKKVSDSLVKIEKMKLAIDKQLLEKRKKPTQEELVLENDIRGLKIREAEIVTRMANATQKVANLEELVRSLKEDRSLKKFLIERTSSDDYKRHLGLISTIRQDFESLAKRLSDNKTSEGNKPLDRIILFIDDLDRCPSDKVINVLKAIHLLLAYPLFVVVVGVDPLWLQVALESTHDEFLKEPTPDKDQPLPGLSSKRYLEKIFQIPFKLRDTSELGYREMIGHLLQPQNTTVTHSEKKPEIPPFGLTPNENPPGATTENKIEVNTDVKELAANNMIQRKRPPALELTNNTVILNEEALQITPWEAEFAAELSRFFSTPRSIKRFSNTYRILKACVNKDNLASFEGTASLPGDFQIPMLLLALSIGNHTELQLFLHHLYGEAKKGNSFTVSLESFSVPESLKAHWEYPKENLKQVSKGNWFPQDYNLILNWLPFVKRFSFDMGETY